MLGHDRVRMPNVTASSLWHTVASVVRVLGAWGWLAAEVMKVGWVVKSDVLEARGRLVEGRLVGMSRRGQNDRVVLLEEADGWWRLEKLHLRPVVGERDLSCFFVG